MSLQRSWKTLPLHLALAAGLVTAGVPVLPEFQTRPAVAQQIVSPSPEPNARDITPEATISGLFEGGSVDIRGVRIRVNGQDVTSRSVINPAFFTYRPEQPLPLGRNTVQVEYSIPRGPQRSNSWEFFVQQPQETLDIREILHNGDSGLPAGTTFQVAIYGTPGAQASALLIRDENTIQRLPAREASPGVYVATLPVQREDTLRNGIVVGRLRLGRTNRYAAADLPVFFNRRPRPDAPPSPGGGTSTQPLQPQFVNVRDGDRVSGRSFTLLGQTAPNAVVRVTISSEVPFFGGAVNLGTRTILDRDYPADGSGRFQVDVTPTVVIPGTRYRVRATARQGNATSSPTELNLVQN
ncbi:MAG: hypothetical protein IGQ88_03050 [Gloeomargaritaceae cyanobacterium C42_A2020_066]|nr:hypothetical protein [Gloeomargaritaceae cyanobacterium C42_A2020_066]